MITGQRKEQANDGHQGPDDLAHLSRGAAVVSKCTQDLDDMVTATKLARQFGRQAFGENPAKGVLCWIEAARRDPTAPRDFYW